MSSIDGLRCITMDKVPIDIILENLPKPIRVTGFELIKTNDIKSKTNTPKVFTFSPESILKKKVE